MITTTPTKNTDAHVSSSPAATRPPHAPAKPSPRQIRGDLDPSDLATAEPFLIQNEKFEIRPERGPRDPPGTRPSGLRVPRNARERRPARRPTFPRVRGVSNAPGAAEPREIRRPTRRDARKVPPRSQPRPRTRLAGRASASPPRETTDERSRARPSRVSRRRAVFPWGRLPPRALPVARPGSGFFF